MSVEQIDDVTLPAYELLATLTGSRRSRATAR